MIACVLGLSLVLLVIWRGRRSPLATPLTLLVLDLTASNFADDAWDALGKPEAGPGSAWHLVDHALSSLTIPLALVFTLHFVGARRPFRLLLQTSWLCGILIGLPSLLGMVPELGRVAEWGRAFNHSPRASDDPAGAWYPLNLFHLAVAAPIGVSLLIRHAIRSGPEERRRAGGVLAAMAVLVALGITDLLPGKGLGLLGYVVFVLCLSVVVLRPGFELSIPRHLIPRAVVAASCTVGAWIFAARHSTVPAVVLLLLTVLALVWLVIGLGERARKLEKERRSALHEKLGQFSDQFAHNLRNPLAALKGASELLEEELHRGRSLEEQEKFVRLLLTQVNRLEKVVGDYRRLGAAVPDPVPLDLNSVVSGVLALQSLAEGERIRVRSELDESLPLISGDPLLLRETLENLLRNSAEALPNGGNVTVRTGWLDPRHVYFSVQDDGAGIEPRTYERLQEFYTTKPGGSGLGLAFARRIAEAHGGGLKIKTAVGKGTTVTVSLAVADRPGPAKQVQI